MKGEVGDQRRAMGFFVDTPYKRKTCRRQNVFMGSAVGDSSLSSQMIISFRVSSMLNEVGHQQLSCSIIITK
jgi:hypothetical protein